MPFALIRDSKRHVEMMRNKKFCLTILKSDLRVTTTNMHLTPTRSVLLSINQKIMMEFYRYGLAMELMEQE